MYCAAMNLPIYPVLIGPQRSLYESYMTVGTTSPVNQTNLNGRGPCQPPLIFHCPPIKSATLSIPKVKSS